MNKLVEVVVGAGPHHFKLMAVVGATMKKDFCQATRLYFITKFINSLYIESGLSSFYLLEL